MQKIVCMKWGTRYDFNFVNRLYSSIKKHTKRPTKLYCFTDDRKGINNAIVCKPLPKIKIPLQLSFTPWRKLSMWQNPLGDLENDVLFLDLDLVITGNLDRFFDYKPGKYCVIENWTQKGKGIGNTSCFRFPVGNYSFVYSDFEKNSNETEKFISELKTYISSKIGSDINFRRVESVGPKVSSELLKQGITAIALSLAAMLFYIWVRFEWQFSLGSIIALFHDVIITLGIFSILSLEVNLSIVAAVLTIVGYSMNDTVVIYDRIRENLLKYSKINTNEIANISVNETLSRTIITSLTTLLALGSIFVLGGEILKGFSFAMILGVIIGTYSSIFVASPVLNYFKVTQKTLLKDENI